MVASGCSTRSTSDHSAPSVSLFLSPLVGLCASALRHRFKQLAIKSAPIKYSHRYLGRDTRPLSHSLLGTLAGNIRQASRGAIFMYSSPRVSDFQSFVASSLP